jgi:hypothetical protein
VLERIVDGFLRNAVKIGGSFAVRYLQGPWAEKAALYSKYLAAARS